VAGTPRGYYLSRSQGILSGKQRKEAGVCVVLDFTLRDKFRRATFEILLAEGYLSDEAFYDGDGWNTTRGTPSSGGIV